MLPEHCPPPSEGQLPSAERRFLQSKCEKCRLTPISDAPSEKADVQSACERGGLVSFLNALPFSLPFTLQALTTPLSLSYATPIVLAQQLERGELDIALTSSWAYDPDLHEPLPGYGIAAHRAILSVNLYTRVAPEALTTIAVPPESLTSVVLLRLLCREWWHVSPHFVPLSSDEEAFLWIGDRALATPSLPGYTTIDLASVWYTMTSLPFVFARFLLRKGVSYQKELWDIEAALRWSEAHHPLLLEAAHRRSSLPQARLSHYYSLCHYRLFDKELEGLSLFYQLGGHASST